MLFACECLRDTKRNNKKSSETLTQMKSRKVKKSSIQEKVVKKFKTLTQRELLR